MNVERWMLFRVLAILVVSLAITGAGFNIAMAIRDAKPQTIHVVLEKDPTPPVTTIGGVPIK